MADEHPFTTPVFRVTLYFADRTPSQINSIVSALHARAQEHGGFVGLFVSERGVELGPDEPGA